MGRNHQSVGGIADGDGVLDPEKLLQTQLQLNDHRSCKALRCVIPSRKNAPCRFLVLLPIGPIELTDRQQLAESWFCAKNGQRGLASHSAFQHDLSSEPCRRMFARTPTISSTSSSETCAPDGSTMKSRKIASVTGKSGQIREYSTRLWLSGV